jgi:hypothetical protein
MSDIEELYAEKYEDEYFQNAKDEFGEYRTIKCNDISMNIFNTNSEILTNKEELRQIAFDNFIKDYEIGLIKE